jgi:hypothetical protein
MDFETWKTHLERDGIHYKNDLMGPRMIFYFERDFPKDFDFDKLFKVLKKYKNVAKIEIESSDDEYSFTIEMEGAFSEIIDIGHAPSEREEEAIRKDIEKRVKKYYESQPVQDRLKEIRNLMSELEQIV